MTPGTFLFDDNFQFHDGAKGKKIFVLLNNGSSGEYLTAKTTSRGDRYGIQYGCQILDRFPNFYFVRGSCFLKDNTWVQLDAFYEFGAADLLQKVMSNHIKRIGVIDTAQMAQLLTCASHAEDLTQHQESIVNETMADIRSSKPQSVAS